MAIAAVAGAEAVVARLVFVDCHARRTGEPTAGDATGAPQLVADAVVVHAALSAAAIGAMIGLATFARAALDRAGPAIGTTDDARAGIAGVRWNGVALSHLANPDLAGIESRTRFLNEDAFAAHAGAAQQHGVALAGGWAIAVLGAFGAARSGDADVVAADLVRAEAGVVVLAPRAARFGVVFARRYPARREPSLWAIGDGATVAGIGGQANRDAAFVFAAFAG